jgi:uncharacterized coiled-coil DUF342 family protein|tara:strand:+ start:984 stop:1163 length:180 start_codon:yes stop_codon:yes gene_type:complete
MRDLVDDINSSIGKKLKDFQNMTREFEDFELVKDKKDDIEEDIEDIEDDIETVVVLGED